MGNKNLVILIALVITLFVSYVLFFKKYSSSLGDGETSFAIADTSSVTKVVLTLYKNQQKSNLSTTLTRVFTPYGTTYWMVNDSFSAQPDRIKTFLETIQQVSIRSVLSSAGQNTALDIIKKRHVRVEIYTKNGQEKVYFVGDAADENRGTYMQLRGSAEPFITEIPGFSGILNPRYEPELDTWRENIIFKVNPDRLTQIELKWPGIDSSYKLIKSAENNWQLTPSISRVDSFFVSRYVQEFKTVYGLAFVAKQEQTEVSKLLLKKPDVVISLTETQSNSVNRDLTTKNAATSKTTSVQLYNRDVDTYYALVSGSPEWRLVQKGVLRRILQKRTFFGG
jgi:hypothetical protein